MAEDEIRQRGGIVQSVRMMPVIVPADHLDIASGFQQTFFQQVDVRFRQDGLVLSAADHEDRDFRLRDRQIIVQRIQGMIAEPFDTGDSVCFIMFFRFRV